MSLELYRKQLNAAMEGKADLTEVQVATERWFSFVKQFEAAETFERAFADNRMTAREFDLRGQPKDLKVQGVKAKLDTSIKGLQNRLNPEFFQEMAKKKNELGLHDLSTVLLRGGLPISKQLFGVKDGRGVLFVPLPLEEDLQTFYALSQLAKAHKTSSLYMYYTYMRAEFTRIKYGQDNDMAVGFGIVDKGDGKTHVRYGVAGIAGGALNPLLLKQRMDNALNYKSKIAESKKTEENTEVTITCRKHAGQFPLVGVRAGAVYHLALLSTLAPYGTLSDDGVVTRV